MPENRPSATRWGIAIGTAALLLGLIGPATAQLLQIGGLDGQLGFGLNFENEEISQEDQDQHLDRLFFEERLGIHTRGAFYHPDLVRFNLGVELGLFQDEVNTEALGISTSRSGDGLLTGYDFRFGLLGAKPYNLDLFGHRSENNTRRDFAGRVETDLESLGATVRLQNFPLRSLMTIQQQEVRQRFTLLPTALQQDETRRIASYYGERRGDVTTLTVDYRFDDVADRARPRGDFQIHSAGLTHFWRLGKYLDQRLGSSVRLFRREGVVSTTSLLERETLALRHSRSLNSNYSYAFSFFDGAGTQRMSHSGFAGLQHRFYESLGTGVNVNVIYTDLSPGTDITYGGAGGFGYRKRIFWGGALLAGVGSGYQINDRTAPAGRLTIFEEAHQFPDGFPITLDNPDVIESTIVVTDEARSIIFAEGIDYFVERLGRRTLLRRNVFGEIEAGQTVLVSYDFEAGQSLRVASRPLNFNAGLDFNWINLFYRGERLRQDVLRGEVSDILGPIDTDTAGVEIRLRYRYGGAYLLNEYVTFDAVDLRYRGFNLSQSATASLHRSLTLTFTGIEGFFDFSLPERTRTFYSARGSIGWQPFGGVLVDAFAGFRHQRETDVPRDRLIAFGARGRWSIGLFILSLSYDHDILDIGPVGRVGDLVRFQVIRRF